jgi:PPOX class probable F420-dependent enzyme
MTIVAGMSIELPASHIDLLSSPYTGSLATVGSDGTPQVTALWYLLDDGVIKISLNSSRQKLKNLQQRPIATLFIIDPANPGRTLEVRATVELARDPDYELTDRVVAHYGNLFNARDIDGPGQERWIVTLNPKKVNVWG